jgi:multiple sugar transport system ATP-binding protein
VQTRVELMRLHQRLGVTTLYVTHDQVEAMTMGRRIAVMRDGLVQQLGTPDDVYNRPANAFVATFIGAPAMNLVAGRLAGSESAWRFEGAGFNVVVDAAAMGIAAEQLARTSGQEVSLGIRPEAFRLGAVGGEGIPGTVQLLEPVGSDLFLTVEGGGGEVQVRTAPDSGARVGDNVALGFDIAKCHLFDSEGRSLRYPADEAVAALPEAEEHAIGVDADPR